MQKIIRLKEKAVCFLFSLRNRLIFNIDSKNDLDKVYFSFTGEFGYEVLVWTPYLNYISKKFDVKLNIACRKGAEFLYTDFARKIVEYPNELIGDGFGNIRKQQFNLGPVFTINEHFVKYKSIQILSIKYLNTDIHSSINTEFYKFPKIKIKINQIVNIKNLKNFVVINNKNHYNWNGSLRNFYNYDEIKNLTSFLKKKGFKIIYNDPNRLVYDPSSSKNKNQDLLKITQLIENDDEIINLSDFDDNDILKRNYLQLFSWKNSKFVIGVHGGSVYLPAFLGKDQFIVFRQGNYFDFIELSRITNTKIKCFYEESHMVNYLNKVIDDY